MSEFDDLGPSSSGLDYESQRYENAAAVPAPNDYTFDLSKCANCDNPPVFTLDLPQFETVAYCGSCIPPQFQAQAVAESNEAEVASKVKVDKAVSKTK
jgi:hypothetical protein